MSGNLPEYDKIVRWTINDVGQWLVANAFNDYCKPFREHGVDGAKFVTLEMVNLNQMRTPMNKRSKLINMIKSIEKPEVDTRRGVSGMVNDRRPPPSVPQKDYHQPNTDSGFRDPKQVHSDVYKVLDQTYSKVVELQEKVASLEATCADLRQENDKLKSENQELKSDIDSGSVSGSYGCEWSEEATFAYLRKENDQLMLENQELKSLISQFRDIDSGSASGSDDDYEWNENEFDEYSDEDNQGDYYMNVTWYEEEMDDVNSTTPGYINSIIDQQESGYDGGGGNHIDDNDDIDDQDDYENFEGEIPAPPPKNRINQHGGTIVDKLKDALSKRGNNSLQRNQAAPSHHSDEDGSSSDYEDPVEQSIPPPPKSRHNKPDTGPSQPPVPSRAGRKQPPPPRQPEVEQPAYEESVQNEPEQVYDEPDRPSPPSIKKNLGDRPPIPVPGKKEQKPRHRGPRPPPTVPEPEQETYEVPDELAPAPPVSRVADDDQELYEEPDNDAVSAPPPPSRHKPRTNFPPRPVPSKSTPDPSKDTSRPVLPPPRIQKQHGHRGKVPIPSDQSDAPGYMAMGSNQSPAGIEPEDDYLAPDELNDDKPKISAPPPVSHHQPAPVKGRIRRMEDMTEEEKKQFKLPPFPTPAVPKPKTTPTRELPPPPTQAHRPLPRRPEVPEPAPQPVDALDDSPEEGDFKDDLENYDWYKDEMTRDEGDKKLRKQRTDGMYLIRKSKGGGSRPYTLMIFNNNNVFNLPIRLKTDNTFALGNEKRGEQTFDALPDMVTFFQKRTIILGGGGQTRLKFPLP